MSYHRGGVGAEFSEASGRPNAAHGGGSSLRGSRSRRAGRVAPSPELGAVTAEVAVVLPALVVLLALLLGTAHVGAQQLRLEEAARAGAREIVRGESDGAVYETAQRLAGSGAVTSIVADGRWSTVSVRAPVSGPLIGLLDLELTASASGRVEQGE